mgnify:CR=1 FL=1
MSGDPEIVKEVVWKTYPNETFEGVAVSGNLDILYYRPLYGVLHMTVPVTPVYIILLILRHKILAHLKKVSSIMSKETKLMHKQLLRLGNYDITSEILIQF